MKHTYYLKVQRMEFRTHCYILERNYGLFEINDLTLTLRENVIVTRTAR